MNSVLITGVSGFIGKALCTHLIEKGIAVKGAIRTKPLPAEVSKFQQIIIEDINQESDWTAALKSIDAVVHLAARVHVMRDKATDPLAAFRQTNVAGTLNLARQAASAGVKRFVFISSIKVNGEVSASGRPFTAADAHPYDAYAISKYEAEAGLRQVALETGMEVVIIRPPLVYGNGVRANFLAMMRYLDKGIPLPFGAIANRRSLIALDNLVDVIMVCLVHPAAANQTFLVSDGEDLSTTELLKRLASAMDKKARLLPVPSVFLRYGLLLLGKDALAKRLCSNLQVDISKTRELLGWIPRISVTDALFQTAQHYLSSR